VDATLVYRNACLNAIGYLEKWGHTGEQAHLILRTSPIEGRIGGVVDIPDACCPVFLPTEIFDEDIRPGGQGRQRRDRGQVCATS
jgi:formamidase